jgi:hypothetical protein
LTGHKDYFGRAARATAPTVNPCTKIEKTTTE